jgi:hypothetical protein
MFAISFIGNVQISLPEQMERIVLYLLQSCPTGRGGAPAVDRYTRNNNVTSDFIDNVVAEEEHFEGYGDPKVYCSEDKDD